MGTMDRVMRGEKLAALPTAEVEAGEGEGGEGKGRHGLGAPAHDHRQREVRERAAMQVRTWWARERNIRLIYD